ncbi:hypothetical protein NDU88_004497 [Pleurodeles waltl]|uniref:Secreted protein n=1 Tax=Pleurodeles waltl TaxID=8319 RepID=A0AAV7TS57_PLEWA|nr:hypothetical protein NDU88_004497 [Pleurodeles waltl]
MLTALVSVASWSTALPAPSMKAASRAVQGYSRQAHIPQILISAGGGHDFHQKGSLGGRLSSVWDITCPMFVALAFCYKNNRHKKHTRI